MAAEDKGCLSIAKCSSLGNIGEYLLNRVKVKPVNLRCLLLDRSVGEDKHVRDGSMIHVYDDLFSCVSPPALFGCEKKLRKKNKKIRTADENFPFLETLGLQNDNLWFISLEFLLNLPKLKYLFLGGCHLIHPKTKIVDKPNVLWPDHNHSPNTSDSDRESTSSEEGGDDEDPEKGERRRVKRLFKRIGTIPYVLDIFKKLKGKKGLRLVEYTFRHRMVRDLPFLFYLFYFGLLCTQLKRAMDNCKELHDFPLDFSLYPSPNLHILMRRLSPFLSSSNQSVNRRHFDSLKLGIQFALHCQGIYSLFPTPSPSLLSPSRPTNADPSGKTMLHISAERNHWQFVEEMLSFGASPNTRDSHGGTPLYRAARSNAHESVELLLQRKADMFIRGGTKETALGIACLKGWEKTVSLFLKYSPSIAKLNEKTLYDNWWTPVHHSVVSRQTKVTSLALPSFSSRFTGEYDKKTNANRCGMFLRRTKPLQSDSFAFMRCEKHCGRGPNHFTFLFEERFG